jgi:hypothetical protein
MIARVAAGCKRRLAGFAISATGSRLSALSRFTMLSD